MAGKQEGKEEIEKGNVLEVRVQNEKNLRSKNEEIRTRRINGQPETKRRTDGTQGRRGNGNKRLRVWLQAEEETIRCSITKGVIKVTRGKNVHIWPNISQ